MKRLIALSLALLTADASARPVWINATRVTRTATTASVSKAYHALRLAPTTPLYYCDYTKGQLCGIEDWYWRESPAYTYRNASNAITYGPNNLVLRSADMAADPFTSSRVQTISVDGNSNYILKCMGDGSIAYSGGGLDSSLSCSDTPGSGEVLLSPTADDLVLTPTGTTTNVRLVKVLTETTFADRNGVDDVNTGSQPYFGPRVDKNGWLVEGVGNDNRARYSNAFDNAVYAKTNTSFTGSSGTSPDGTNNAWLMTATSTFTRVTQAFQGSANDAPRVTVSLRVKYNTAPWLRLCLQNSAGNQACRWFNLQAGVVGTATSGCQTGSCTATMEPDPYGDGWYIATFTATISIRSGAEEPNCDFSHCATASFGLDNSEQSWNNINGQSAYIYGFQVAANVGRTSYLPTIGARASNFGEVADMSDVRIAQAKAIVFETASAPGRMFPSQTTEVFGINNRGPKGASVRVNGTGLVETTWGPLNSYDTATSPPIVATTTNGAKQRTASQTSINRYGVAYDGDHISLVLNGGSVATKRQSTPIPAVFTLSTTSIFWNGLSFNWRPDNPVTTCNCYVRSLALYQSLTDAQLKAKTTEGAAP